MARDIGEWLEQLGLDEYAEAFAKNRIKFHHLADLSEDDLRELGVAAMGDRKTLSRAIASLADDRVEPAEMANGGPEDPPHRTAEAERRQLTVMFCDLVGSTALSTRLDPEDMREVMRRYQDTVAGVVARFEGHIAKFLGDGVLAFFGWPRAYEDQAERAVRSGLAAVEAVANLKTDDGQALEARVGIATGHVVIGDIVGKAATEADAVAGETPNLAARLQGLAAPGQVVIGATTRLLISETFNLTDLGTHDLKGFAAPVAAWHVVGVSAAESRFEAAHTGALTRLVGREHELGLLRRAWEQSQAGIGQVVLVSGEPGIGKSRLIDALDAGLKARGCTRITLGCSPYHTNSALYPIIVHLERVLGWQEKDNAEVKLAKLEGSLQNFSLALDEAIPLFASLLSLPLPEDCYPPLNITPQQQRQQTLDAIVACLLEEAERHPVLQVWEDLHWADPSTLELLALEIEQAPTAPILNVLTFRPEFAPPWPQRSHMTPLTLNRLERPEVEALITQHATGKALPSEVVEHIVNKTDGVPLYVEELTKAILEAGFLRERDGGYELTGPLSGVAIPATLQDSLMARLDRLPGIREVAQLGAVLGREFTYEMVRAIAPFGEAILQEGLDRLVDAELLYQRGRLPRAKYIFKHALVQDAAYQSLLKRTRQELHRKVAELLESQFPEAIQIQPELLAHHYAEAGLAEKSAPYWYKAGQRAIERSANTEAIAHLTKGLELLDTLPETAERSQRELTLQIALGVPLQAIKGPASQEVERAYSRARELCRQENHAPELFPALWGLWRSHVARAKLRAARELAEELLNLAERQEDAALVLQAHHALWATLLILGEFDSALKHIEQGIALYSRQEHHTQAYLFGGHDPCVCAHGHAAIAMWLLGFPDQALDRSRAGLTLAEELSHPVSLVHTLSYSLQVHLCRREARAIQERAETLLALASEQNFVEYFALGTFMQGWAQTQHGNIEAGVAAMHRGLAARRATGREAEESNLIPVLAEALGKTGSVEEGLKLLNQALAVGADSGIADWEAELHRLKGELLICQSTGNRAEAEASYNQAIAVARRQQAKSLELRAATSLARLWQGQCMHSEARELLEPVYDWFTEGFDTPDLIEAKELLNALK